MMMWKLTLLVLLVMVFGGSSAASAVPITNGLVAAYEFSGNADDVSGNGNDGVVNGATSTTDRFGNANSAYSFDGIDDYIGVADAPSIQLQNSDLTISMWVKLMGSDNQAYDLIDKEAPASADHYVNGFLFHTLTNATDPGEAGIPRFCVANNSIGGIACFDATTNIVDGTYHHLVVTRTSANAVAIYIDGVDDGAVLDHQTSGHSVSPPESMLIGARHSNQNFFNGLMDDVYIYDRALSSGEIQTLYSVVPEPNTALLLGLGLASLSVRRQK